MFLLLLLPTFHRNIHQYYCRPARLCVIVTAASAAVLPAPVAIGKITMDASGGGGGRGGRYRCLYRLRPAPQLTSTAASATRPRLCRSPQLAPLPPWRSRGRRQRCSRVTATAGQSRADASFVGHHKKGSWSQAEAVASGRGGGVRFGSADGLSRSREQHRNKVKQENRSTFFNNLWCQRSRRY